MGTRSAWCGHRRAATGVRPRSVALRSTVPDLPQSRPFLLDSSNERRSHVGHSHVCDRSTPDYYAVVYFTILRSFEDTFYARTTRNVYEACRCASNLRRERQPIISYLYRPRDLPNYSIYRRNCARENNRAGTVRIIALDLYRDLRLERFHPLNEEYL